MELRPSRSTKPSRYATSLNSASSSARRRSSAQSRAMPSSTTVAISGDSPESAGRYSSAFIRSVS